MSDPNLRRRLDELLTALGPSAPPRPITAADVDNTGADGQRIATAHIDDLLRRVSALTATLGSGTHDWDDADRIAARLLMADLAAIASTTRALNDLSASRLASALADLRAAGVDLERALKEASGS